MKKLFVILFCILSGFASSGQWIGPQGMLGHTENNMKINNGFRFGVLADTNTHAAADSQHVVKFAVQDSTYRRWNGRRWVIISGAGASGSYLPLSGGTMAGPINMATNGITNVPSPSAAGDAVNKLYADNLALGLVWKDIVVAATRVALPTNVYNNGSSGVGATITEVSSGRIVPVDGITLKLNDRLLVKNESDTTKDGIFFVSDTGTIITPFILTRSLDANTGALLAHATVAINSGDSNANKAFTQITTPVTVGTSNIIFVNFLNNAYLAGRGLNLSGQTFSSDTVMMAKNEAVHDSGLVIEALIAATYRTIATSYTKGQVDTNIWDSAKNQFYVADSNKHKNPVTLDYANQNYYPFSSNPAGYITSASGGVIRVSVLTSTVSATFTTQPGTTKVDLYIQGPGGGGGGCKSLSAGNAAAAGGGGGGGYTVKYGITVTGSTGYTYQAGTGGAGGTITPSNGSPGTASVFTVGIITYTANGGFGGVGVTGTNSTLYANGNSGGAAVSSNCDICRGGNAGTYGRSDGTTAAGGMGGTSEMGGNGISIQAAADGASGSGSGGGGGGAVCIGNNAHVGGPATNGKIIVVER